MLSSGEDGVDDINSNWPADAHYTPPLRGTRVLSVLSQPEPMKQTLRAAFRHVTRDALFRTAYPSINTLDGQDYQKTVLCDCAKRLRFYELVKRFGIDDTLVKLCTSVVRTVHFLIWEEALMLTGVVGQLNSRVASIGTCAKEFTDKKVEGFYQLVGGEECRKRVIEYTKHINYIYPGPSVRFFPLILHVSDVNSGIDCNLII